MELGGGSCYCSLKHIIILYRGAATPVTVSLRVTSLLAPLTATGPFVAVYFLLSATLLQLELMGARVALIALAWRCSSIALALAPTVSQMHCQYLVFLSNFCRGALSVSTWRMVSTTLALPFCDYAAW